MNTNEYYFPGESAVHRKMFWMAVVLRARPTPGANHQKPRAKNIKSHQMCDAIRERCT